MKYPQEIKNRVLELKKEGLAHRFIASELSRSWPNYCGITRPRNWNDVDISRIVKELENEGKLPVGGATSFHDKVRNLPRGKNRKTVVREGAK